MSVDNMYMSRALFMAICEVTCKPVQVKKGWSILHQQHSISYEHVSRLFGGMFGDIKNVWGLESAWRTSNLLYPVLMCHDCGWEARCTRLSVERHMVKMCTP
ncbi:hypothetical protein NX059_004293 [Plenodomus lindquistii]|nr:hypothetical protein NX059_004293 [Plenodomus lindquistii]